MRLLESLVGSESKPTKDQVTVVLPTLNEKDAIGRVIDDLKREGYKNILVIDGYSTNGTVKIVSEKNVKFIYQHGQGKAGAIKTAIDHVETPYMLVMDADYTYDPKDIEVMLSHISKYDEVIGLRRDRDNIPLLHRFGNRVISTVLSLLMGQRISDPCSGMYLLRTDSVRGLEFTSGSFDVEVEIVAQMASFGRVTEVPVSFRRRVGISKIRSWKDGCSIVLAVFKMAWLYNPIFLISALAALFAFPGAAVLLWQLTLRYLYGAEAWSIGWTWLGLILLIVGLQAFTVSSISLMIKRMERRLLGTAYRRDRGFSDD